MFTFSEPCFCALCKLTNHLKYLDDKLQVHFKRPYHCKQSNWLIEVVLLHSKGAISISSISPKPCPGTSDLILWSINIKIVRKHKNEWSSSQAWFKVVHPFTFIQGTIHNHLQNFDFGFILNEICELKINGDARSECH